MKSKFTKAAIAIAIAVMSGINVFNVQKSDALSDTVLANIEALADLENRGNKSISDVLVSMDYTPYCIIATYERTCAWGGISECSSGTYTIKTPMY